MKKSRVYISELEGSELAISDAISIFKSHPYEKIILDQVQEDWEGGDLIDVFLKIKGKVICLRSICSDVYTWKEELTKGAYSKLTLEEILDMLKYKCSFIEKENGETYYKYEHQAPFFNEKPSI